MTIENLKILAETTVEDFPDKSLERFIKDALKEHEELQAENTYLRDKINSITTLVDSLVWSRVIDNGVLLAKPKVFNELIEELNEIQQKLNR